MTRFHKKNQSYTPVDNEYEIPRVADDHKLLAVGGARKRRIIKRAPEENRWRPEFLALVRGLPRNAAEDPAKEHTHQGPVNSFRYRRMYNKKALVGEHNATQNCRAC